ncbi:hypothetical protein JTB14_031874 [Gonioctena quinquepunctata]|nr:hypothetical protein JTB14_031874 [Gonioctena quinquepunctata]
MYDDARTSTTENSPQIEEKIIENPENMELNHEIKLNIKQSQTLGPSDKEGSVHPFISNLEEGNNPKLLHLGSNRPWTKE